MNFSSRKIELAVEEISRLRVLVKRQHYALAHLMVDPLCKQRI